MPILGAIDLSDLSDAVTTEIPLLITAMLAIFAVAITIPLAKKGYRLVVGAIGR